MDQLLPSTYYHIFNHANSDEDLFREPENYRYFLQQYNKHIDKIADTYAYCQMLNPRLTGRQDFHLLVRIKAKDTITSHLPGFGNLAGVDASKFLSKQFSNFFNGYTKAFNNKYDRSGSLFLKPFKKKAISDREYLAACILYIHLNPVKHGFRKHPKDWEWSSYHSLHLERLDFIDSLFINQEKYFQSHEEKIKSYDDYDKPESYFLD